MKRVDAIKWRGFTLVEVVVVMAVVAILTAIALPNYWAYVARSNRSEARGQLLIAANWVERWRTQQGSYLGAALPPGLQQSPAQGVPKYTIALPPANLTAVAYLLQATPVGPMVGDICGVMTVDQSGRRTPDAPPDLVQLCWVR